MPPPSPDQVSEWVRIHGPYLWSAIRSFSFSEDECEDVFQEIWVIVLRKLDRAPRESTIRAWLYSISIKVCLGRIRTTTRRKRLLEKWPLDVPKAPPSPSKPGLQDHFRNRELWERIGELPDLQRKTLLLRVVEDMTTEETARALQRAKGTVKASLHRALHRLKDLLAEGEPSSADVQEDIQEEFQQALVETSSEKGQQND